MTFRIPADLETKAVTTTFHLNNQEAKRDLAVYNNNNNLLTFCTVQTYLGVKLDRSLTFPNHIEALRKKLKSCVALLRELAGLERGVDARILLIAAFSLVYLTFE